MTEIERLYDQLIRAFEGEAWHGPSLREALAGVTWHQAMARPVPSAHSIWEIVLHLAAWNEPVRRRLSGERVDAPEVGDWPEVTQADERGWLATVEWLQRSYADLKEAVRTLPESRLDERVTEGAESTTYVTIQGAIQHYLYHAGQIVLLRKAVPGAGDH